MANDITLSNAVRTNLLSLQNTADLLARTQERLATGKKVNSALDNPTNFFTASSLNARSGDLNSLLDGISNGIQALQAADKGISSITKLIETAQATARQALQTASGDVAYNLSTYGTVSVTPDDPAQVTGIVNMRGGATTAAPATVTGTPALASNANVAAATGTFTINGATIDLGTLTTTAELDTALAAASVSTGLNISRAGTGEITITAVDTNTSVVIAGAGAAAAGLTAATTAPTNPDGYSTALAMGNAPITDDTITDLSGETLTLTYGTNSFSFTFGTGQGQISNLAQFNAQLAAAEATVGGSASFEVNGAGRLVLSGDTADVTNSIKLTATSTPALMSLGFPPKDSSSPVVEIQANNLLKELGLNNGDSLTFRLGENGPTQTIVFGTGAGQVNNRADLVSQINNLSSVNATLNGSRLEVTAADASAKLYIGGSAREEVFGETVLSEGIGGNIPENAISQTNNDLALLEGQQLKIQLGDGSIHTITMGTTNGRVSSRADLLERLNGISKDLSASFDSAGRLKFQSTSKYDLKISGNGASALGLTVKSYSPVASVNKESSARNSLQNDFNYTLSQIDTLTKDASYNGINLLFKDNLSIIFNEDGSSQLNIEGVEFTFAGLGLVEANGDDFQKDSVINSILDKLGEALTQLRTQASKFGSNLAIVQTRQDFTKNLINVLDTGASNLTLADSNGEAANALALQTRQSLSTTALSLSNEADQSILQLFR